MKKCLGCGKELPVSSFTKEGTGLKSRCKECRVKETANWRKRNGKRWVNPLTNRLQIMTSHLCHAGSTLRTKDIKELYNNQQGKCAYTGLKMKILSTTKLDPLIMSIDRIDPSKGYTKNNVCLCCLGMNYLKSAGSIKEMYETLAKLSGGADVIKSISRISK